MWMNVLEALMPVMTMQLAPTLKGVTSALATMDTQEMGFLAQVSAAIISSQSAKRHVEIEGYSVVYFDCIAAFEALYPLRARLVRTL